MKILTFFFKAYRDMYPSFGEIVNQLRAGIAVRDEWAVRKLNVVTRNQATASVEVFFETGHIDREIDEDALLVGYMMIAVAEMIVHLTAMNDNFHFDRLSFYCANLIAYGILPRGDGSVRIGPRVLLEVMGFFDEEAGSSKRDLRGQPPQDIS